jgi:two-component system phosphate regulon sensor histidine kinase PhoR
MTNTIVTKTVQEKIPKKNDLLEFYYVQNPRTNKTIVYSNSIISEDYNISSTFFDKKFSADRFKTLTQKRVTEIYNGKSIDKSNLQQSLSTRCES